MPRSRPTRPAGAAAQRRAARTRRTLSTSCGARTARRRPRRRPRTAPAAPTCSSRFGLASALAAPTQISIVASRSPSYRPASTDSSVTGPSRRMPATQSGSGISGQVEEHVVARRRRRTAPGTPPGSPTITSPTTGRAGTRAPTARRRAQRPRQPGDRDDQQQQQRVGGPAAAAASPAPRATRPPGAGPAPAVTSWSCSFASAGHHDGTHAGDQREHPEDGHPDREPAVVGVGGLLGLLVLVCLVGVGTPGRGRSRGFGSW